MNDAKRTTVNVFTRDAPGAELPRYKCHKEVWALKIKAIIVDGRDLKNFAALLNGKEFQGTIIG